VDGALAAPPYPKLKLSVKVMIGGQPAEVIYSGAAPGLVAGVVQVNARVPAGIVPISPLLVPKFVARFLNFKEKPYFKAVTPGAETAPKVNFNFNPTPAPAK
jgi:hypothetical protein